MNKSFIFEKIQPLVDEYACVLLNNKWGVIDKNDNVLIPFIFDWIWYEQNNFSGAEINNKCGYVDNNGNPLNIEPIDN